MRYPLDISPNEDGTLRVSICDLEGAVTACDDLDHLFEMALDAFRTSSEAFISNGAAIPLPSSPKPGQSCLELPIGLAAKVLLLNEMIAQNMRPTDLARKMNTKPQNVNRLVKLHTPSRIEHINEALGALGKSIQLTVRPALHGRFTKTQ